MNTERQALADVPLWLLVLLSMAGLQFVGLLEEDAMKDLAGFLMSKPGGPAGSGVK